MGCFPRLVWANGVRVFPTDQIWAPGSRRGMLRLRPAAPQQEQADLRRGEAGGAPLDRKGLRREEMSA